MLVVSKSRKNKYIYDHQNASQNDSMKIFHTAFENVVSLIYSETTVTDQNFFQE
jgi:hypothetical protein